MYLDYSPNPRAACGSSAHAVLVLEEGDTDIEEILENAPTTRDADGDLTYWIVYANAPKCLRDFTESSLRRTFNR